ncbi:TraX family protein [Desulfosporosinus sp. SB140]|uniref:TraX family protein n=1 Tax=Desulfosporosinus paludis TaxID=3115649 RepID=UPI00388D8776
MIQIVSFLLFTRFQALSKAYAYLANGLIPNLLTSEGALIFIVLGIFMYVFRNNRLKFSVMYIIFSVLMFASAGLGGFTAQNLFYGNYQWMMIIALPLMLSYNGERGKGLKYFFYAFYPLHIWILFLIANLIQRK